MHKTYIKSAYLLLVLVLFITACNDASWEKQGLIVSKEYLTLPTPELTPMNSQVQMGESDSGDCLLLYNYFDKIYQFLEFPSGKLRQEIPIKFEGVHSVRGLAEGMVTSLNSFWVFTNPPALSLFYFDGEIALKEK